MRYLYDVSEDILYELSDDIDTNELWDIQDEYQHNTNFKFLEETEGIEDISRLKEVLNGV